MTNIPRDGRDDLIGVQESVQQAGNRAGSGKNSGRSLLDDGASSTSQHGHIVNIVEQPGLDNYPVGVIDLSRNTSHEST